MVHFRCQHGRQLLKIGDVKVELGRFLTIVDVSLEKIMLLLNDFGGKKYGLPLMTEVKVSKITFGYAWKSALQRWFAGKKHIKTFLRNTVTGKPP